MSGNVVNWAKGPIGKLRMHDLTSCAQQLAAVPQPWLDFLCGRNKKLVQPFLVYCVVFRGGPNSGYTLMVAACRPLLELIN